MDIIDKVIEQISKDLEFGDTTSLEELLRDVPAGVIGANHGGVHTCVGPKKGAGGGCSAVPAAIRR